MSRLPLYIGLGFLALGGIIMALTSEVDFFGDRAGRELATARVEIGLMRAENRAYMRDITQIKKDHACLYKIVEDAYMGIHPETKRKINEKAIPPVAKRPGR